MQMEFAESDIEIKTRSISLDRKRERPVQSVLRCVSLTRRNQGDGTASKGDGGRTLPPDKCLFID